MRTTNNPSLRHIVSHYLNALKSNILTLVLVSKEVSHSHGLSLYGVASRYSYNLIKSQAANLNSAIVATESCASKVNLNLCAICELVICSKVELKTTGCVLNIHTLLRGEVVELHARDNDSLDCSCRDSCAITKSENLCDCRDILWHCAAAWVVATTALDSKVNYRTLATLNKTEVVKAESCLVLVSCIWKSSSGICGVTRELNVELRCICRKGKWSDCVSPVTICHSCKCYSTPALTISTNRDSEVLARLKWSSYRSVR